MERESSLIVQEVDFLGDQLMAAWDEEADKVYVGVSWVCKGLGFTRRQTDTQLEKIQSDFVLSRGYRKFGAGVFDENNETLAIELDFLPLWLAKVAITPKMQTEYPELAQKMYEYQLRVKDVLVGAFIRNDNSMVPGSEIDARMADFDNRLREIQEILPALGKYLKKVGKGVEITKYFILRNQKVKKNSNWSKRVGAQIKALAEKLEVDGHKVLSALYMEITDRFEVPLDEYREDFCYINNVSTCSMLAVIESSNELRNYFEVVLSEVLARFGICVETHTPKRRTVFDVDDEG